MESVADVIKELVRSGVEVYLDGEKLKAKAKKGNLQPHLLDLIKSNKPQILNFLQQQAEQISKPSKARIVPVDKSSVRVPASFAQQRLWVVDQMEGESSQYNMPSAMTIRGQFNIAVAETAFSIILDRHDSLRTVFLQEREGVFQVVREASDFKISVIDLADEMEEQQSQAIEGIVNTDRNTSFDLANDLMLRVTVIILSPQNYVMSFNTHHIASDGWSIGILVNEFVHLYQDLSHNKPSSFSDLPIQYADYSIWQREWMKGREAEKQLDFWNRTMLGAPQVHSLPITTERPKFQTFTGAVFQFNTSNEVLQGLQKVVRSQQVTMFMLIHAVFVLVLSRYSNSEDIVIGTPVANRLQKELELLVGFFVNTLILRTEINGELTFAEFLHQVKKINLDALSHQDVPFEHIVENLKPERSTSFNALFQIMFSMNTNEVGEFALPGIELAPYQNASSTKKSTSKFDLTLTASVRQTDLSFCFEYNVDLFDEVFVERISNSLLMMLEKISVQVDTRISELPILAGEEIDFLRNSLNSETTHSQSKQSTPCIHRLFESIALASPDNIALVFEDSASNLIAQKMNYAELNERANQLAHYLISLGLRPDEIVGICVERSVEMIVAILAVLKAGAAYLPLDPEYPIARLETMINDSQAKLIVTQTSLIDLLKISQQKLVVMDGISTSKLIKCSPIYNPKVAELNSDNLAYIIYTSGSTGSPKGVMVEHKSLANHSIIMAQQLSMKESDKVLQFASMSFDTFLEQTFSALIVGASLYIKSKELWSAQKFYEYVDANQITTTDLSPSYLLELLRYNDSANNFWKSTSLSTVVVGGENLPQRLVQQWFKLAPQTCQLINAYGPTEATITTTLKRFVSPGSIVSIGSRLPSRELYVLDKYQQLVPFNCVGELYIGGDCLARGYLNNKDATAVKFITGVKSIGLERRVYMTGDLVKYNTNGELEFVGRVDEQIKIRGFRIELGEIEHCLNSHPAILQSVVIVREDQPGVKQIVAYFVCKNNNNANQLLVDLKAHLSVMLPAIMIPTSLVELAEIPLMPNGKIARSNLPLPKIEGNSKTLNMPIGKNETVLLSIWSDLLNLETSSISADSNFFELGGDSILSIQMVSRAAEINKKITVKQIFEYQTIRSLAPHLIDKNALVGVEQQSIGKLGLLPIQYDFFANPIALDHYNQAVLLVPPKGFDFAMMVDFVKLLIAKHDCFRLRFSVEKNETEASYVEVSDEMIKSCIAEVVLKESDFTGLNEVADKFHASLSIQQGPIFRSVLFTNQNNESRWLLTIHHLIIDGVSWRIILNDLESMFSNVRQGKDLTLPRKTSSYQQWSDYLREYSQSKDIELVQTYWQELIGKKIPGISVANLTSVRSQEYAFANFKIDEHTTSLLLTDAQKPYKTHIIELLLSALTKGLYLWSGNLEFRIDLEGHGRQELNSNLDLSETVGWFTSICPYNLVGASLDWEELICLTKENYRGIPNKGIDFGLLKYIKREPEFNNSADSEILFNYLGQFAAGESQSSFSMATESRGKAVSELRKPNHLLNFNGAVSEGVLSFGVSYDTGVFVESSINLLLEHIKNSINELVKHCIAQKEGRYTSSDFPLSSLENSELFKWQKEYDIEDIYPATSMQQGLLFHSMLNRSAYVNQLMFTLSVGVDTLALKTAWQKVIDQCAILRTSFVGSQSGQLQQIVNKQVKLGWSEADYSGLDKATQDSLIEDERQLDKRNGFSLEQGSLIRIKVWKVESGKLKMLVTNHHAALDGWSIPLLFEDVSQLYRAEISGVQPNQVTRNPFKDYVNWLSMQNVSTAEVFWRTEFGTLSEPTQMAVFEAAQTNDLSSLQTSIELDEAKTQRIVDFAQHLKTTVNIVFQAAWSYLLYRYTDENSVVFGTTVSGRPGEIVGVEKIIGLFINTIPVKVDIDEGASIKEWIKTLHEKQVLRDEFSFLPLTSIHSASGFGAKVPLFNNLLVFENFPIGKSSTDVDKSNNISIVDVKGYQDTSYELSLTVHLRSKLNIKLQCRPTKSNSKMASQLLEHLTSILIQLPDLTESKLKDLELLSQTEKQYLLNEINHQPKQKLDLLYVHEIFELQVSLTPEMPAVVFNDVVTSYLELDSQANVVAEEIIRKGFVAGGTVGICLKPSLEVMVSILAVLKVGGAYVPLDPKFPSARLNYMIEDSAIQLLITESNFTALFSKIICNCILLDEFDFLNASSRSVTFNGNNFDGSELAYVIYTSGSTGNPKGVGVEHRNIANYMYEMQKHFTELDGSVVATNLCFDGTITSLLPPLCSGKYVKFISDEEERFNDLAKELVNSSQRQLFKLTPSFLDATRALMKESQYPSHHLIVTGGEPLYSETIQFWSDKFPNSRFMNHYGPTETTVGCSTYPIDLATISSFNIGIPIGKPIQNSYFYILDKFRRLVPFGAIGELYIGGEGVARGYLNQSDLSKESFMVDDYSKFTGKRVYKTGDLVRYLACGSLLFCGRIDHQIKIRGYRIELGEIEDQLTKNPNILSSVVIAKKDNNATNRLVAYLVASVTELEQSKLIEALRKDLKTHLPIYMMPSVFVFIAKMPLSSSGKIDRKLLSLSKESSASEVQILPQGEIQLKVVKTIGKILNIEATTISMCSNFFDLGGDSLLIVPLVSELKKVRVVVTIKQVYEHSSLSDLCNTFVTDHTSPHNCLVRLNSVNNGVPIHLIHPMGGRIDCYHEFAKEFEDVAPVFGIQAPFIAGIDLDFESLTGLAEFYADAIMSQQQCGPYQLGGWSIGGLLAHKVAEVLVIRGEKICRFIAFDSYLLNEHNANLTDLEALRKLVMMVTKNSEEICNQIFAQQFESLKRKEKLEKIAGWFIENRVWQESDRAQILVGLAFGTNLLTTNTSLHPIDLLESATLFVATETANKEELIDGWKQIILSNSKIIEIAGSHLEFMQGDSVREISKLVKADIEMITEQSLFSN